MSVIRASSKKILKIFDEENDVTHDIYVRRITRTHSVEYGRFSAQLVAARNAAEVIAKAQKEGLDPGKVHGALNDGEQFEIVAKMIIMRTCEESVKLMDELLDRCIAVEQYNQVLEEIMDLFKDKDISEKKPDSQNLTPSSTSASAESTSTSKE